MLFVLTLVFCTSGDPQSCQKEMITFAPETVLAWQTGACSGLGTQQKIAEWLQKHPNAVLKSWECEPRQPGENA